MAVSPRAAIPPPGGIAVGSARGRWVLVAAGLGSGMAGIASSVMNVALPVIGRDLGAGFSQLQWTVTGYTLSLAALILLSGALGDHFGRRRVFLIGVIGFTGGWLLELGTWRWIFVINVPVAAVLVLVAVRRVPESRAAAPAPMDWPAAVLAVAALAAVTYVLTTMPGRRSASALSITIAVIAVAAPAAFCWHERHAQAPLLPAALFRSVPFVAANLVTFFVYGALGAFSFVFTVALETISGYSPIEAGSTLLPITIIALLLSGRSGQLAARIGPRPQMTAGPFLCAAAALLAVRVSAHTGYWTTVIPLECVFGLGIAALVAPLMSTALSSVPADHAGVASGVNNAVSRAAALVWIAAVPPLAGLSGSSYATATALRGGYQEICVICAASLALAGTLAAFTLRHRRRHPLADIVPPRLPHPAACH